MTTTLCSRRQRFSSVVLWLSRFRSPWSRGRYLYWDVYLKNWAPLQTSADEEHSNWLSLNLFLVSAIPPWSILYDTPTKEHTHTRHGCKVCTNDNLSRCQLWMGLAKTDKNILPAITALSIQSQNRTTLLYCKTWTKYTSMTAGSRRSKQLRSQW